MRLPVATTLLLAAALTGCMNRPYQGQALYALDGGAHGSAGPGGAAARGAPPAATPPVHACILRVQSVGVMAPYGTNQFVYRYADGRMRTDPYAGFIANPDSLIRGAILARLQGAGLFQDVVGGAQAGVPAYDLQISIRTLGAWFDGASGTARIEGTAFVTRSAAGGTTIQATLPLAGAAPVATDDAVAVAEALNAALAQCLDQLVEGLRRAAFPALVDASSTGT